MVRSQRVWHWKKKRRIREGLPKHFRPQAIGVPEAIAVSNLPAPEIASYLRKHPDISKALLYESYDKRFTPSSFIEERGRGFRVGWFTGDGKYEVVQEWEELADAATDYLLLSLGTGRWRVYRAE